MKNAVRVGAMIAATTLFIVFLYLVLTGGGASQFVTVALLLVFAVMSTRLDDIEKLTFGTAGVAADLTKKLQEAQATADQLQAIAEVLARLSVTQISSSNRWGGLMPTEKRQLISEIEEGLRRIDLPESRIKKVLEAQFRYDDYDYFSWTMEGILHSNDRAVIEKREAFVSKFPKIRIGENPPPDEVEALFNGSGWNSGENYERLADWKHYRKTGSHRRLSVWERRYNSGAVQDLDDLLAAKASSESL